jgi:hypothetical protein
MPIESDRVCSHETVLSRRHQDVFVGRQMSQSKTLSSVLPGLEEGGTWRFAAGDRGK